GRRPTMIFLELDGEFTATGVDVGAAGRPALVQSGVDTDDLPDRPLRRIGAGPFGKPHPQGLAEVLLQPGVVDGMRRAEASLANRRGLPKANAMFGSANSCGRPQ